MFGKICAKKTDVFELRGWLIGQYYEGVGMEMSVV
jgi:hypothetical protein